MFVAINPERHAGSVIADGHCVRFVQHVSTVPHTAMWTRGRKVRGGDVPPGTVIATFNRAGNYTNSTSGESHAAVLIAEQSDGLQVWDQWQGQPVHQRLIRFRGGQGQPANDGDAYHVVEIEL